MWGWSHDFCARYRERNGSHARIRRSAGRGYRSNAVTGNRMRTKVMLGICGIVAALHVPAFAQAPSFRDGLERFSSVSNDVASYRFRPLDASERRRSAAVAQEVPMDSGSALSHGWRFRPLRSEAKARRELDRSSLASVNERPWKPFSPRFSSGFYASFTHLDTVSTAPYADWRASAQLPPERPARATSPRSTGATQVKPAVYVMFRGKRYRFRDPSARIKPLPDPTSSYLGEESLFAAQSVDRTWVGRRDGASAPLPDVMVTPFATIPN